MSYRDADIYSDVVDVLDNLRDNVDAYLAAMQDDGDTPSSSSGNNDERQPRTPLPTLSATAPCRTYIKENGPLVMRLSESVQSVLRCVVERQRDALTSPTYGGPSSRGPTPEAARSDAVRALVTRKLGEVMENAHAMRSIVKQQQQLLRSKRFAQAPRTASATTDAAASSSDLRMKQLLRVLAHDLEDTERLLRIAFPEAVRGPALSSSPVEEEPDALLPTFALSGGSYSPDRPSVNTTGIFSSSETPRHSTSTAPYVRRSESMETPRLPRQPSPSGPVAREANHSRSGGGGGGGQNAAPTTAAVSAAAGAEDDSVLHSLEASVSSSLSGRPTSPRVRFAMESDEEGGSSSADHSAHSLLRDAMEHNDLIRTGGLASNPVHLRHNSVSSSSTENNASRTHSNNASGTANGDSSSSSGSAINRAAATVGRSFNSVLGNVMQLAPFTHRRPSLTADPADSSTTGTTSHDQDNDNGEDASGERRSSEASGTADSSNSAATLVAATETKAYNDALHIIASAEKPRGILKTSSSRLAAASGVAGGRSGEGNSSNNNNNDNSSTSRLSGASSPGASRPFVQFVDDVLPPSHPHSSSGGTGNNTTTSYNDSSVTASEGDLFCGGASAASSFSMNHSSTSIGSGRLRGLPPGLPPRSPRNPEALSASVSQPGGQRPPLAPSASASLTSFAAPTRNVWVTSTHSQRLPGELWANILAAKRRVMEEVLREDVVDLFNYGEEETVLHLDDVSDIRFNVIDAYLYVRFELEHRRSLTESEINLRLGLCSYPLMTGLYEEYFQEYQAHEFEPIEDSLTTLSNLTTPMHGGSTRLSLSSTSPSYQAEHRLASTVSLSLATPQLLSPPVKGAQTEEDHAPIVSPLSIATDNSGSQTTSMIGDLAASFPFTPHGSGAVALPPSTGMPPASAAPAPAPAATTSVPAIAASPTAATVGKAVGAGGTRRPAVALATASLTATAAAPPPSQPQRQKHQDTQHPLSPPQPAPLTTSGTINPSTIDTPRPAASRRNARHLPERDSATLAASATTASFAVAARQRDSPATSTSPSASSGSTTPSSSNATNASSSDSSSATRRAHAHTVRLPGQHWEAVTLRVPEGDLADAFVSDVGTALGVLPSEARAACQHPRFYLGSLVVKFRWNNAELYPGAAPLSAAEVDAKLADYAFPALHRIYGLSCAALHLADDLNAEERRPTAVTVVVAAAAPSPAPVAQMVLPDKTSLDECGMDEAAACESSTISDERDMQHRGEGAPSRSPSTSLHTPRLVQNARTENTAKGGARVRQTTPTRTPKTAASVVQEVEASATVAAPAAAVPEAAVPREASPDPVAATHHVTVRRDGRHPDAEAEPRVATPQPTQPSAPSRSRSSQRHSHSPVPAARVLASSGGGEAAKSAADAAGVKGASRSRSKDGARGATAPPRRTPSTSNTRPAHTPATTTTTTTTLTKLARQHNTSLKALLQWNPTLAHIDPEKAIAVPESLIIPRVTPTSTPPPPSAPTSQSTTQNTAASGKADTTSVADTTATAQTGVSPRCLSARRQAEGGIVASLRSRPRLTPREAPSTTPTSAPPHPPPPSGETAAPAPAPVAEAETQHSASSVSARSPPPPPLSVADVAARRASHTSSARAAPAAAAITTTVPPPVVAAAAAAAAAVVASPTCATSLSNADKSVDVHRTAAALTSAPRTQQLRSRSNIDAADALEHSALSQKSTATSHASADPAPQLEKSTGSRQPASVQRVREASPRSAQAAAVAAAAAAAEPPDHLVYHLPPGATAAVDPLLLLPRDKPHTAPAVATAEHLSTARSARRTQRQPLSNFAAEAPPATATAGRVGASKESATTESESGDRESAVSVLTEQEVGLRVCGLVVEGVRRRSAAADAGLQVGDALRTLDGAPLISDSDLQRGLLMRRLAGEQTAFLTAVSAQGNPVTYRLRIESGGAAAGAVGQRLPQQGSSTARKAAGSVASSASGNFSPPSLQTAAVQQRGSNASGGGGFTARHAVLLSPPARQAVTSQTARSFSGARRPQTTTTATSTGNAAGILRGEAVQATSAARTRVSSIGAATRETQPQRSHSNKVLRETAAPATVHATTTAAAGASRPLSARRTGRDQLSAARVRPDPQ